MSGRDEIPMGLLELTFPECTLCQSFSYWEGDMLDGRIIFFNPIEYQEENSRLPVIIYVDGHYDRGRIPTLQEIADVVGIKCNECENFMGPHGVAETIAKAVEYIVREGRKT